MRLGILKDIDWDYVGALLARSDDNEQSKFFKSFVKECLTWGTHHQVEMQLAYVNSKLSDDEIDVLGMITYKKE